MLVPITINPEKSLLWDLNLGHNKSQKVRMDQGRDPMQLFSRLIVISTSGALSDPVPNYTVVEILAMGRDRLPMFDDILLSNIGLWPLIMIASLFVCR